MRKSILLQCKIIPDKPGIYLFKNKNGAVLYVGKAKNLKKRVNTYFLKPKKLELYKGNLVENITNIDYISTNSEYEALLLESNLIKQHKPKYNVRLKDDKNYIYIKVDYINDYPKIYTVRKIDDLESSARSHALTHG